MLIIFICLFQTCINACKMNMLYVKNMSDCTQIHRIVCYACIQQKKAADMRPNPGSLYKYYYLKAVNIWFC